MRNEPLITRRGTKADLPAGGTRQGELRWATDTKELFMDDGTENFLLNSTYGASYKGSLDCSANPNYPAADLGFLYFISVSGKVGGASGHTVTAGDAIICEADDTPAGTEAAVGDHWTHLTDVFSYTTVDVGTTTTGAEGTDASVTNTGTNQNAIFAFTIPKGDKGDTGSGITDQTVGFTATGGTTPKTLTVALDANVAGTNTGDETAARIEALTLNELNFDTTPVTGAYAEGTFRYSEMWHTFEAEIGRDVVLQIGQEEHRRVYNDTGSTILNGQPVYTSGVYVDALPYVATVALARANSSSTYWCLGLATQDIPHHNYGFVTVRGHINDVDSSSFTDGDVVYLSADTAGALTATAPEAPNYKVRVGRIIKAATAENHGTINVRILSANRLNDLADVHVPAPVAGQILKHDGVSWIAADSATVASAGGTDFFLTDQEVAIEGMTRAAACVVTWTAHGLATGAYVQFTGITQTGWTALNWTLAAPIFHKITWIDADHLSIPVNTSGYAGDYVPATDPGTISSGKIPSTPDTTISEVIDSAQSTGSVEALIDTYSTASPLGRTVIEGGVWNFETWCYASSTTNINTVVIRVYKRNTAGTETELFSVETADLGTTNTLSRITSIQPAYVILATDHLVIKYFAKSDRGSGAYRTCYITHNGTTHYTYVSTPLAILHDGLGGLNAGPYSHLSASEKTVATQAATASNNGFMTSAYASKIDGLGNSTGVSKDIHQHSHGFVVGDVLYLNGTTYTKAIANAVATAEVVGMVSAVAAGDNDFTLSGGGYISGLTGLTAGTIYFLSPSTVGTITATEPTTIGQVSKPVLITDTTTSGYLFNMRGMLLSEQADYPTRFITFTFNGSTALTTDAKAYQDIPIEFNGMKLVSWRAMCVGVSSSGVITIVIKKGADSMFSTNITIDAGETSTDTALNAAIIDTDHDDIATGDVIEGSITGAGTGVTYCKATLGFRFV
jgi:hypothetical protein